MKSKQAKTLKKVCTFGGVLLAIAAFVMIFLPQIVSANDGDTVYNGLKLAFGYTISAGGNSLFSASAKINFSFPNLLAYLLVTVGLVFLVLQMLGIGKKNKLVAFVAAAALIAGGILFFFPLQFSTITTEGGSSLIGVNFSGTHKFAEYNSENSTVWKLGYGAIAGGITAISSGVLSLGKLLLR